MRIDHYAYQQATRVALIGLVIQFAVALALLLFGIIAGDSTIRLVAPYAFVGVLFWLALAAIFHQHRLERLEALEHDELRSTRGETGSVFDEGDEVFVQRRRLGQMHKWLMPAASVVIALALAGFATSTRSFFAALGDPEGEAEFFMTNNLGWAVAICLSVAAVCFIFSRFVAGMSKQPAWQNLRGGAGAMVGTALLTFAVAIGFVFRYVENDAVLRFIAQVIPWFMYFVAAEIVLNLLLNFYRPRVPGEVPRPAFDSRVLSLFTTPDSLVRSLNEAVNYQFGFDITSSWGYQLLVRSFARLVAFGVIVLILMNMIVIVEPHQQAVRLRGGDIVGDEATTGLIFKWPWPIETVEIYDVSRVRDLHLTARRLTQRRPGTPPDAPQVDLWTDEIRSEGEIDPLIVGASTRGRVARSLPMAPEVTEQVEEILEQLEAAGVDPMAPTDVDDPDGEATFVESSTTRGFSLVDSEIILRYRIKSEPGALLRYLRFSGDQVPRRQRRSMRDLTLQHLALREVTAFLPTLTIDDLLTTRRGDVNAALRERVQDAFDRYETGVEVVALNTPLLRPAGDAASAYEEVSVSRQVRRRVVVEANQTYDSSMVAQLGSVERAQEVIEELAKLEALRSELGTGARDAPEYIEQRVHIESLIRRGRGQGGMPIAEAEADGWIELMELRAQAAELVGEAPAYRESPYLYKQLRRMEVFARAFPNVRKIITTIDPERIRTHLELDEAPPTFSFQEGMAEDEG
jgi:modulator of FtsH protease HflK